MQNTTNDYAESTTDAALLEMEQSELYVYAMNSPGPEDENEDDDEDENDNSDKGKGSTDDDPPIDEDVVHSPLPPQTGGKPRKQL